MISSEMQGPALGQYVDIRQKQNGPWQVGLIISRVKGILKIRFDGWSNKFDELIHVNSSRLKPFRSFVRGYTGQQKNPAIRDHLKYSNQFHQEKTEKLKLFLQDINSQTQHQITQYLRGEHYFYVDFLLTVNYSSQHNFSAVYQYLGMHISMTKTLMDEITEVGIKNWCSQQPLKFSKAYRQSYYEIFDAVYIIGVMNLRQINYQKHNQAMIKDMAGQNATHQKCISKLIVEAKLQLSYLKLLELLQKETQEGKNIQIAFLFVFYQMYGPIQKALNWKNQDPQANKQEKKRIVLRLLHVIKRQFQLLTSAIFKISYNEQLIESLLNFLKSLYFRYGLQNLVFQWIEKSKLRIFFLLLQSQTLEKKLKGILKIKDFYEQLIAVSQFQIYKLAKSQFKIFMKQNKIVNCIFFHNQHPEILKKGSQLCLLLLRDDFIQLQQLLSIWNQCSHKHQAIRKVIYQLWIDTIPYVSSNQLSKFSEPIIVSSQQIKESQQSILLFSQQWQIEVLINFITNLVKRYEEILNDREAIDKILMKLLNIGYKKLLNIQQSNNIKNLMLQYAKIIHHSLLISQIMREIYKEIARQEHLNLNINLLISIYQESVQKETFVPSNALQIVFFILQSPKNIQLSSIIFQFMDEILNFTNNIKDQSILNKEQLSILWKIGQKNQQIKVEFYGWLLKKHNEGIFGKIIYQINNNIDPQLRVQIFNNYLCDFNKMDYINLNLQELEIFKQFLIYYNERQKKVQIKRLMSLCKIIRIRENEIIGNKFMWDIFLNCKNEQVIMELSKLIISFHLNFHENIDFKVKKAKIVSLLGRIEKHIRDGFKKGNLKLMKHSLIILKDIIDIVKEKKPTQYEPLQGNNQQFFKTVIKIQYDNKKFDIQTYYGTTFYEIKSKIAQTIKVQRTKFQMINSKNEQITLDYSCIPLFLAQQKTIKIVLVDDSQQNIPNIVLNFIKDKIENTLIQMLQDEIICQNVYNVLQDIDIKAEEGQQLQYKLNILIEKCHKLKKDNTFSKYESYICLLYLKVLHTLIQKPKFLNKYLQSKILANLILRLDTNFSNPLLITYIFSLLELIQKILKMASKPQVQKCLKQFTLDLGQTIQQKCMSIIYNLCVFINQNLKDDSNKSKKIRIIFHSLFIIEYLSDNSFLNYFIKHEKFKPICYYIYLKDNMNEIRLIFSEKIKKFIKNSKKDELNRDLQQILVEIFIKDLYDKVRDKEGHFSIENKVGHFYKFISFIVAQSSKDTFSQLISCDQLNFYNKILENVKMFSDSVNVIDPVNYILSSHLQIIASFYKRKPQLLSDISTINYIMYDCLFYQTKITKSEDVCCKKTQSIKSAIQVLQAGLLEGGNKDKFFRIIKPISQIHKNEYWRTNENWNVAVQSQAKAKYTGLINPGCICYCNSLLQQLFMTKNFKNSIYKLKLNRQQQDSSAVQMLKALKELFFNLQLSQEIALNPVFFTKTIKNTDNKPMIKIFVQMDIDEFCSILFDKIQQQITFLPKENNIVKDIFGGIFAHQIISKQCNHCSQREQQFISIGLEVKKHILQSFGSLVKGQILDGQNKYYCQKCDKKVKAEKMLTIKTFPKNLILSIKRFEYNYEIDAKIKINDYCQFPTQLNLKKFSQQQINKINNPQKNKNIDEEQNVETQQEFPDEYFQYKLKGVVVHTGSADSGHYYSFIQDKDKNWFEFNDNNVSNFDVSNLAEQTFGCKDPYQDKTKNAYLLFYERFQHKNEQMMIKQQEQLKIDENNKIASSISTKNKIINKFRLLFSKDYSSFINYLNENIDILGEMNIQEQASWHEFLISYFLLIKIREENLADIIKFSKIIMDYIDKSPQFNQTMFEILSNFNFLEQIFVYCSNRDKSKIISYFLTKTFLNYYQLIQATSNIKDDKLISNLLSHIYFLGVLHGNLYEIEIFLRKILVHTKMNNDLRLLYFMTNDMDYIRFITINLFALPFTQEKDTAVNYKEQQKQNHINNLIKIAKNQGKKSMPSNTKESWHLLQLLVEFVSKESSTKQQDITEQDVYKGSVLDILVQNLQKGIKNSSLHRIIYECNTQKSVYKFYKTCTILGKTRQMLQAIEKGLKDYQSTKYRPFLILLSFMYADKNTPQKIISQSIDTLAKIHANNQKYFIQVNFLHQWMIKYASLNQFFAQSLCQNHKFLVQIINWIAERPYPSPQILKKHKILTNQRLMQRLNGILVSSQVKQYQQKSKSLRIKFNKILKKSFERSSVEINFDYLQIDEYPEGSSIMFFDMSNQRWVTVKVKQNHMGYLRFDFPQRNKTTLFQMWQDNERISSVHQILPQNLEQQQQQQQGFQSFEQQNIEEQQDLYN